ncbi:MAG: hypothetical protein EA376_00100 [Phycisphaeraceae bacterium]|nr:MAG: hypothetical protein EA376_00100 [Phycisphaeraceae bacterium]
MEQYESFAIWSYTLYLSLSVAMTIWVAWTLHSNGRVFLVDIFNGDERLADSLNHLLVVGFYLINIGYILLALRMGTSPRMVSELMEVLSMKLGVVLLVLGAMHFGNLGVLTVMRRRTRGLGDPIRR